MGARVNHDEGPSGGEGRDRSEWRDDSDGPPDDSSPRSATAHSEHAAPTHEKSSRLFFALWPTPSMQAALADSVSATVRQSDGRLVPTENFHLTLAFLGSVPRSRFTALAEIAARCASSVKAAELPLVVTLDAFEHWRRPHILCATASVTPPPVSRLAKALKRSLIAEGFTPDLKPFRAHATFARKVHRVNGELHAAPVRWTFEDFHLVESRTDPRGSAYSTVEKWALYKRDP